MTQGQKEMMEMNEDTPIAPEAKSTKKASKLYYIAEGGTTGIDFDTHGRMHFCIVKGSEGGFRTKEDMIKFVKALPTGQYIPITAQVEEIVVETVKAYRGI